MKVMSDALQQIGGEKLRNVLQVMTKSKTSGVLSGFMITGILQSSSVITVLVVGLVNAGMLTLIESAGVIMGANIGTTITGWLVSSDVKLQISHYALPILAIGVIFLFQRKEERRISGQVLVGIGLLLMGLQALREAVPAINESQALIDYLNQFRDPGIWTRIFFVLIGIAVTYIVQSSSAAMALTIVLVSEGLPMEVGAAMVLGENIGTTITAELAALVGNLQAKKAARIHTVFNVTGAVWMVVLMPAFLELLRWIPGITTDSGEMTLAAFHTGFNILNTLVWISFVPTLIKWSGKTIRGKMPAEHPDAYKVEYLTSKVIQTPALAIMEAGSEVKKFGNIVLKMVQILPQLFVNTDPEEFDSKLTKLRKLEDQTDDMEVEIAKFLSKIAESPLSEKHSSQVRTYYSIIGDLEKIGDVLFQLSVQLERKRDAKAYFTPDVRERLIDLYTIVLNSTRLMFDELSSNKPSRLKEAVTLEKDIDDLRDKLRKRHLKAMEKGEYNFETAMIYNNLINGLEKIGDYNLKIHEALNETFAQA